MKSLFIIFLCCTCFASGEHIKEKPAGPVKSGTLLLDGLHPVRLLLI